MSSLRIPQTPEATPIGRAALRRSFTVPPKLDAPKIPLPATVEIGAAEGIETLYVHPSAKVVSFSTSHPSSRPSSRASVADAEKDGTLLWASPTERTLAADGVSKFAMRVLPETYYRIELPGETEDDKRMVGDLKVTLQKVLWYERTACPFQRSFTVELPEAPNMQRRRSTRRSDGPAKRWSMHNGGWKPEGAEEGWRPEGAERRKSSRSSSAGVSDEDPAPLKVSKVPTRGSKQDKESESTVQEVLSQDQVLEKAVRPGKLAGLRSVTAPPHLTIKASPPSKPSPAYGLDGMLEENQDTASDVNSGSKSPSTPELPPTPVSIDATQDERFPDEPSATPAEDERLQEPRQEDHTEPAKGDFPSEEAVSDHCQDSSSDRSSDFEEAQTGQPSQLATPALTSDSEDLFWSEVQTPPETIRLRHRNVGVSDRAVSPHPDMSRLYRSSPSESQRALTGALVRKTCAIFLGPPAHLVTLMLRIAAKIADGAFSFTIHTPERGRRVPGSWDLSDDEGDWDIDEYGSFPLQNAAGKRQAWEVR